MRQILNWLNLSTPFGLLVARAGGARVVAGPQGLLLAEHYRARVPAPNAPAVTIGDVVLLRLSVEAALSRPGLIDHEARHCRQYAFCLGLFGFLPGYFAACLWSWWHTGNFALRNVFEVRAGLVDGGYVLAPPDLGPPCPDSPGVPAESGPQGV